MGKIKDAMLDNAQLANKELESCEPKNYKFEESKHFHSIDGKALLGASTVVGVLAKPLTWWAAGLACEKFGWTNKGNAKKGWTPKEQRLHKAESFLNNIEQYTPETWLELCDEAYSAHSKKLTDSAKSGTDLHAELEKFVLDRIKGVTGTYPEQILPFIRWTDENVNKFLWSELNCFSEKLLVGGISDVGVELKNGEVGILDFKSSKESYDSQFIQCAGYDLLITENGGYTPEGNKVFQLNKPITFYGIVPFGAEQFIVDYRYNVEELKEAFKACVTLYKLLNK